MLNILVIMFKILCRGHDVLLLDTGLGCSEEQHRITELLYVDESTSMDDRGLWFSLSLDNIDLLIIIYLCTIVDLRSNTDLVSWSREEMYGGIRLKHSKVDFSAILLIFVSLHLMMLICKINLTSAIFFFL